MANHDDLDIVAAVDMNRGLDRAEDKRAVPALLNGHGAAEENKDMVSRKQQNQDFSSNTNLVLQQTY